MAHSATYSTSPHDIPGSGELTLGGGGQNVPADLHDRKSALLVRLRFERCLEENRLREVWQAVGPDGKRRLVIYVKGFIGRDQNSLAPYLAEQRLTSVRHPYLLRVENVVFEGGRVVIVTEWAECTWAEYFRSTPLEGPYGLRRQRLLSLLSQAAEALDFLRREHALMHLGLSPRVLWWREGQAAISDYGVVELLLLPQHRPAAQYSPRYAAPEVFAGRPSWASDQFSLAAIYQELLTGAHPFRVARLRDLAGDSWHEPDLEPLPAGDRDAVARALARNPADRFPSCSDFVRALQEAPMRVEAVSVRTAGLYVPGQVHNLSLQAPWLGCQLQRQVSRLVGFASRGLEVREYRGMRYRYTQTGVLQHTCAAVLAPGIAWEKVMGFLRGWPSRIVQLDGYQITVRLIGNESWWQKVLPVPSDILEVRLWFEPAWSGMTRVRIEMEYVGKFPGQSRQVLEQIGPVFLEQLRSYLMATPERRQHERFEYTEPLRVHYGLPDGPGRQEVEVIGQDISSTGIRFLSPIPLPEEPVQVFPVSEDAAVLIALPASILRVEPCEEGYLVAARFLIDPDTPLDVLSKSPP